MWCLAVSMFGALFVADLTLGMEDLESHYRCRGSFNFRKMVKFRRKKKSLFTASPGLVSLEQVFRQYFPRVPPVFRAATACQVFGCAHSKKKIGTLSRPVPVFFLRVFQGSLEQSCLFFGFNLKHS